MASNQVVRLIKISQEAHDYIELLKIFYWPEKTYAQIVDHIIEQVEMSTEYKAKLLEV